MTSRGLYIMFYLVNLYLTLQFKLNGNTIGLFTSQSAQRMKRDDLYLQMYRKLNPMFENKFETF